MGTGVPIPECLGERGTSRDETLPQLGYGCGFCARAPTWAGQLRHRCSPRLLTGKICKSQSGTECGVPNPDDRCLPTRLLDLDRGPGNRQYRTVGRGYDSSTEGNTVSGPKDDGLESDGLVQRA